MPLWAALLLAAAAGRSLSAPFQNLTAYHLNPATAGAIPRDMDTGDALGDLYFYLGQFLLPLECKSKDKAFRAHFDCDNPERVDPNLVVTKVNLEVNPQFTKYSACNLCNGTDPFSGKPCQKGTYSCDCFQQNATLCDATKVGFQDIREQFAPHKPTPACKSAFSQACPGTHANVSECYECFGRNSEKLKGSGCLDKDVGGFCPWGGDQCNATSPEWACWANAIPAKTGGTWYSTLKEGECNGTSTDCAWRVRSTETVHERCMKDKLMTTVENHNRTCFNGCGPRNATSFCWIQCFFDTLLGVEARHDQYVTGKGMTAPQIEEGWTTAFLPEGQGGCPRIGVPMRAPGPAPSLLVV